MKLKNPKIPAGLVDDQVEFFIANGCVLATFRGIITPVDQLPAGILKNILEQLEADKPASEAITAMGIFPYLDRIEAFIKCRFGAFDNNADYDGSKLGKGEYWDCGQHGKCPHEGKLCHVSHNLTKREVDVVKLIAQGQRDKEIAVSLGVSTKTIPVFKRNIEQKTGVKGKVEIAMYAIKHNIYATPVSK